MKKLTTLVPLAAVALLLGGCTSAGSIGDSKPAPIMETPEEVEAMPEPTNEEGTREAPLPYGYETTVYELASDAELWKITVGEPFDGTVDIAATNQFNSPPAAGNVYQAIPVHIVWLGEGSVQPWFDFEKGVEITFVSADGVTYSESLVTQPWPSPADLPELYTGGAADFTTVVEIPAGAPGLVRVAVGGFHYFVGVAA